MTGRLILIVDDSPCLLATTKLLFVVSNWRVSTAMCAAEAMTRAPDNPDAILLDLSVGSSALGRELRKLAPRATLILFSGCEPSELRVAAVEYGADSWISKGVAGQLVERVERILERKSQP